MSLFGKFGKNHEKCEAQERPEGTQERPRGAQERPKGAPRASRRVPRGLSRRSGELSGTILTLASSKKERSENDQWGDSLEMPIRRDFLSILEACAQERICEKRIKNPVFLYVFRKSSPLRANRPARAKHHRKFTKIDMFGLFKLT